MFKLSINEKIDRLLFLKQMAAKFYKENNSQKAEKFYMKIHSYFRSKDAKNNFIKEDEQTTYFRGNNEELDRVNFI